MEKTYSLTKYAGMMKARTVFFLWFLLLSSFTTTPLAVAKYQKGLGNLSCGQEGQKKCTPITLEFWLQGSGGCDRGLRSVKGICKAKKRDQLKNKPHAWISKTIRFQRELQSDLPLNQVNVLWLHNAFNNKNDGYLFPNHKYSLTDLLDLGGRVFELDTHYYGKRIRLCHGEYSHLGCSPFDRLYYNIIEEFNIWLRKKENQNEVVVIKIQNQSDGQTELLEAPLKHHLKDLIFRPSDLPEGLYKERGPYPSINQIRKAGKRVFIIGAPFPYSFNKRGKRTKVKQFDGKHCHFTDESKEEVLWSHDPTYGEDGLSDNWQSIHWDATKYLRFYDGEKETGKITPSIVKEAIECNIPGLEVDWLTVDHAKAFIWTWADGEPKKWGQGKNCAAITQNGRWVATDCKEKLPFACQDEKNEGFWIVTRGRGTFKEGREACKKERYQFQFSHPKNGWENARIYKNNKFKKAWIAFKKKRYIN